MSDDQQTQAPVFAQEWKPQVNVSLNSTAHDLGNDHYEVVVTVTVTATQDESTQFLAEVQQAGIFLVRGMAQEELGPMFGVYCPNILFPYAREVVSDLVTRGSFPQLVLAPVNFDAIYKQQVEQQAAQAEDTAH
ncbi:MAG: protein-export chaperone SecB [Gammaproteobacteria bacterium]